MAIRRSNKFSGGAKEILAHYKVLVIGAARSGKTSFLNRAKTGTYNSIYKSSFTSNLFMMEYQLPSVMSEQQEIALVKYWDACESDLSRDRIRQLCESEPSSVVLLSLDLSDPEAIAKANTILDRYRACSPSFTKSIPIYLLGMKADIRLQDKNTDDDLRIFCRDKNLQKFVIISARDNPNNVCELLLQSVSDYCLRPILEKLSRDRQGAHFAQEASSAVSAPLPALTRASIPVVNQEEEKEQTLSLKISAFKTFYRTMRDEDIVFNLFGSDFLTTIEQLNLSQREFWQRINSLALEDPDSITAKALALAIEHYKDIGPGIRLGVPLLKKVHQHSLRFFSSTHVNKNTTDVEFLYPPPNTRRARIIVALRKHEPVPEFNRPGLIN